MFRAGRRDYRVGHACHFRFPLADRGLIDSLEHLRQRCAATSVPLQNAAESGAAAGVFDLNCGKSSIRCPGNTGSFPHAATVSGLWRMRGEQTPLQHASPITCSCRKFDPLGSGRRIGRRNWCMWDLLSLIRWLLLDLVRSRRSLEAETPALRHQLNVLRRSAPKRPVLSNFDRLIFVCLYRIAPRILDAVAILEPETVIRWHRAGFRLFWRWKSRRRAGKQQVSLEVRRLIREMSLTNPLWGAPRAAFNSPDLLAVSQL